MIAALLDLTNVNSSLLSLPPSRLGSTRGTSVTKPPLAGILSKVRRNAGAGRTGGERRGRPSSDGTTSSTAGGSDAEDEDLKAGGEGGRGNLRKKKSWILVMESLGRKSSRSDLRREEKWLEDDTEDVQEQEEIGMRCESLGRKFVLVRTTTEIKVTSDVSQKLGNTVTIEPLNRPRPRPRQYRSQPQLSRRTSGWSSPPPTVPNFIDTFPAGPVILISDIPYDEEAFDSLYRLETV